MLKAQAWPKSLAEPGWQAEARLFRRQARKRFTEAMGQHLDVAELYADALAGLPHAIDGQPPLPVPQTCAVTLDELLADG
jgi:phytoene/squalene synthetase